MSEFATEPLPGDPPFGHDGGGAPAFSRRRVLQGMVAFLGGFTGTVDMSIDTADMEGVLVDAGRDPRTLRIGVTGVPSGGTVQVLRGAVDYAGASVPSPNTAVVRQYTAAQLSANPLLSVDPTEECFCRLQVLDRSGAVAAFGQPVWLLHQAPATGVPAARTPVS